MIYLKNNGQSVEYFIKKIIKDSTSDNWKEITKRSGKKSLNTGIDELNESDNPIPMGKCLITI